MEVSKPLYYYELRVLAKRGRDSLTFTSWYITYLNEKKFIVEVEKNRSIQFGILKHKFKKKAVSMSKTIKEFNVTITKAVNTTK